MKQLLMGNEAIALAAVRAGVRLVSGYPGTPSTEILETVAKLLKSGQAGSIHVEWSVNEKSALEVAAGAAWSGLRAMVTMKQVGLNVASDPLMSLNYVGVEGGLVVVAADDPGPLSSQTEQDTRRFGLYAKIAVFDPCNPEEACLMVGRAFDISEKYRRPVLLRPTTRVCHSYASVELPPAVPANGERGKGFEKAGNRFVIFPSLAYKNHIEIEKSLVQMASDFSFDPANSVSTAGSNTVGEVPLKAVKKGIAAGGVSWSYLQEALEQFSGRLPETRLFKAGTFPLPASPMAAFLQGLDEVLVLEELDPVIEDELVRFCGLNALAPDIKGKRNGFMPNAGENSVALIAAKVREFLMPEEAPPQEQPAAVSPPLPVRPPVLCAGCPHRASFFAVKEAVRLYNTGRETAGKAPRKAVFCGDIGCYTLGNALPLDMVDTCLCMGAGITCAQGIGRAELLLKNETPLSFAFAGDSTFFHTGIPGIINAVYNAADIIVVILDNGTTAMTGGQVHPGTGKPLAAHAEAKKIDIYSMVKAMGVTDAVKANPLAFDHALETVTGVLDGKGVRVIIFESPCITLVKSSVWCGIDARKCTGCRICINRLGCPAISPARDHDSNTVAGKVVIDRSLCTGCGLCRVVCPCGAIDLMEGTQ